MPRPPAPGLPGNPTLHDDDAPHNSRLDLEFDLIVEADPPPGLDLAALPTLARAALLAEGATGRWQVALVLTDDPGLQALHRDFMGLDTPTDVMTFPLGDEPPHPNLPAPHPRGGDIVVSVDRATAQAPAAGTTPGDEVRFLLLHGLLHLLGHDDATDDQRAAMLARQTSLLAAFDALTPLPRDRDRGAAVATQRP